jgi:hypothetical protein
MSTSRSRSSQGRNDDAAGSVCHAFSSFSSSRGFALVIDPAHTLYELRFITNGGSIGTNCG